MIKFLGDEQDQITFVTRAVRVVDLITNLDMAAFQSHSGLSIFIYRLEVAPPRGLFKGKKGFLSFSWLFHALLAPQHEVDLCRRECPFVIKPKVQRPAAAALPEGEEMETDMEGEEKGARKRGRGWDAPQKAPSHPDFPPPTSPVTDVAMESSSPGPSAAEPAVPSTSAAVALSPRSGR